MDIFWSLDTRPAGISVVAAGRTQALDVPSPLVHIAGGVFVIKADAANNVFVYNPTQHYDIKAMRKLKETDTVTLTHIGSDADYVLVGTVSLHFLE